MKVKCFQVSSAGAVRDHNEDFVVFWEPQDFEERQKIGSIAILADGVGGIGNGDVASRMLHRRIFSGRFTTSLPEKSFRPRAKKAAWRRQCSLQSFAMIK